MRSDLTRPVVTLIIGLIYLALVVFGLFNPATLVATVAVLPLLIVIWGFSLRMAPICGVLVPPVADGQTGFSFDGVTAQAFPQGVTYRIFMRKLWLLAVVPLISFVIWAGVSLKWITASDDNPLPLYGSMAALGVAFWVALRWLHERSLLRMNSTTLVFIQGVTRNRARYEFFDQHGERRGGTERFFGSLAAGTPAPIMVDLRRPDDSRLFLSFWFFRFQVADVRHISQESLTRRGAAGNRGS